MQGVPGVVHDGCQPCQQGSSHSKGPQSPQQVQATLALTLTGRLCLWSSPVYCLSEHPGTCKSPMSQCFFPGCSPGWKGGLPPEVHDYLLCLAGIDLESNGLKPAYKVTDDPLVILVVPVWYASDDGGIVWERLDMAVGQVASEVWNVQTKQKGEENCVLWRPRAADYHLRHIIMKP